MATQTVEFQAVTGQSVTAKLFAVGSDTQVASVSATEATNRKGTYSAAYTDVAAGTYDLIAFVATTPVARWQVVLTLTTATFQAYEPIYTADISAIKAKTDNLPADPADQSAIEAAIAPLALQTSVDTVEAEIAKIPKSGETRRYTQVAADSGNKTADVSIGAPL